MPSGHGHDSTRFVNEVKFKGPSGEFYDVTLASSYTTLTFYVLGYRIGSSSTREQAPDITCRSNLSLHV